MSPRSNMRFEDKVNFVEKALRRMVTSAASEPTPPAVAAGPLSNDDTYIPEKFKVSSQLVPLGVSRAAPVQGDVSIISREEFVKAVNTASHLDRDVVFQSLSPYHLHKAKALYSLFYRLDLTELDRAITLAEPRVNRGLFQFALSLALLHRTDVKASIPSQITYSPYLYFDLGDLDASDKSETEVVISGKFDFNLDSADIEQRLEYYRLDPGMNAHHRHWHEAYLDANGFEGTAYRDRAGELFYYMHQQMLARYNFERLSVGIPFVKPLNHLHKPIPEPYFNKLLKENGKKLWDSRPPNQLLSDVRVGLTSIRVADLERARDRIIEAIDRGYVYVLNEDGTESRRPLNGDWDKSHDKGFTVKRLDYGIDKLGDMVWAFRDRSVNPGYYGNLHNHGHMVIGYSHDADGLYYKQSEGSAMVSLETAARDPVFYRWHYFIDNIFERYKATLPEYKESELLFEGITIKNFSTRILNTTITDELKTKWVKDRVDITNGIPEQKKKYLTVTKINYDFVHLGHEDFEYHISVHNNTNKAVKGVFRIFIAPIYTDKEYVETLYKSGKNAMEAAKKRNEHLEPSFNKLRRRFIELDKFVETLGPGPTSIKRKSTDSSVTVPLKQLFQTLEDALKVFECQEKKKSGGQREDSTAWCGCGWPDYMLIGRGTPGEGLKCHLFVMVSDYDEDKIDDNTEEGLKNGAERCCKASLSYCGLRDEQYPDKKPMGFPFDRKVSSDELLLKDFVTITRETHETHTKPYPNMSLITVTVKHSPDELVNGPTIV